MSWDDWKPDKKFDVVMNAMVVPEGTYEVCSRTINAMPNNPNSNAKWILNVLWRVRTLMLIQSNNYLFTQRKCLHMQNKLSAICSSMLITLKMTGVDINLDTNIGKRLSALSNTLTMLTGEEEQEDVQEEQLDDDLEDTENELPTIKVSTIFFKFLLCKIGDTILDVPHL